MTYRIKSVAALTGISAATLRAWERRYGVVCPNRTESGYRTYTADDVEWLRRIKELTDGGYKVSEAIALAQREGGATASESFAPEELREEVLGALLALDRARAGALMDGMVHLPPGRQMEQFETVLFPILHEIGARWARGEASIVQEHFASAFARERLAAILEALTVTPSGGAREAVCAGAPGERHELGLMAAAVHLALRGWHVTYLGPDLPLDSLEPTLHARRPALVCTSLLRSVSEEDCLALAAKLRRISPQGTGVLVGGPGVPAALVGTPLEGVQLTRDFPERLEVAA